MHARLSEEAREELKRIDRSLQACFIRHMEKLERMPPRRHMKHGLPPVENVTDSARMPYNLEEETDTIWILHCFATHKEYERWYKSYKS